MYVIYVHNWESPLAYVAPNEASLETNTTKFKNLFWLSSYDFESSEVFINIPDFYSFRN